MSELDKKLMQTPDLNKERLEKLKSLFPDLFTVEGKLNPDELKKIIDPDLLKETERFEFKWFGKSEAKRNAFTPSKATLIYDEERSVNPEYADGNMIIEGENLETLKCLLAGYRERVKCIYIDPPYNTGNDFVYSDRWDESKENYWEHIGVMKDGVKVDTNLETSGRFHSNWLNMIYSRLLLSRQLLSDDGVIFISIDDNEIHHLRKLCDDVLGEDNFVCQFIWQKRYSRENREAIGDVHEYIICYEKNTNTFRENRKLIKPTEEQLKVYRNPNNDPNGCWRPIPMTAQSGHATPDQFYEITLPSGKKVIPPEGRCWSITQKTFENLLKERRIYFGKDGNSQPNIIRYITEIEGFVPWTWWPSDEVGHTDEAKKEIREYLDISAVFDTPKPVRLLNRVFEMSTNIEDNDIILDFFSGSGTTAHAVVELNREDGGNRKFILVQIPELTDEKSEAYKAGYKKISDITIERNKRVIQRIEKEELGEQPSSLLEADKKPFKTGCKVYKLAKSNFPRVDFAPDPAKTEEENLVLLNKYIDEKEAMFLAMIDKKNIFDEVLLKNGFMLNYSKVKVDDFSKNKFFQIKDEFKECLICMDMNIAKATLKELEEFKDKIFICLERALDTTMKWNLKHLLGDKLIAF